LKHAFFGDFRRRAPVPAESTNLQIVFAKTAESFWCLCGNNTLLAYDQSRMEIDFDTTHTSAQDVLNVANIDIIIGTASTRGQLDTQV